MPCDTLVAIVKNSEGRKQVVFGKNSDRPSDEVQLISFVAHKKFKPKQTIKCTNIEIPQVEETAAVLLSKPYWMWGAEMGTNEYDVAIGNEAVWTKLNYRKQGLLGMDLLRLGLERGKNAKDALDIIIDLLQTHHQGGFCDISGDMIYHNSFIIADPSEAWILETADDWWVAEKVKEGVRNISNGLSIDNSGTIHHPKLLNWVKENKLINEKEKLNFAKTFSSGGWNGEKSNYSREGRCSLLLKNFIKQSDNFSISQIFQNISDILRDHEGGLCMHGGFLSAGSQISILDPDFPLHYFTTTAPPCLSMYHPYTFNEKFLGLNKDKSYDSISQKWEWVIHSKIRNTIGDQQINKIRQKELDIVNDIEQNKKLLSIQTDWSQYLLRKNHESLRYFGKNMRF